ncbi:JAB1/MPN domain-containing protein [Aureobasidium sp. EXF-3400]|nr:JAB1/MPN domain-containing protein [Aureobasidium sp. EXF-12344]KAI4776207.1 JAB1/MPN domain-containing protein [Aureobasidium sp. EXF-3400]
MSAPKSVEQIVSEASNFDHAANIPLNMALRTAQNMISQAAYYERESNLQDAYYFLYRHADFFFTHISKHPDAKKHEYKAQMARTRDHVKSDLSRMEALKPEITNRYQKYQDAVKRRNQLNSQNDTPAASHESLVLSAAEHKDMALQLANRELRRRAKDPRDDNAVMDDLSRGIQDLGRRIDAPRQSSHAPSTSQASSTYHYPSVPGHASISQSPSSLAPNRPPKNDLPNYAAPPPLPSKPDTSAPPLPSKQSVPAPPPKQDLSSAQSYQFQPAAYTENGTPLRTLFLPTSLRLSFVSLASSNTSSNLETCGILCGTLISNALFISHLVIPDQTATSDTCETTDVGETDLFDYVDTQGLMVCGWIHTHPTQTCFLSSRDLHTSVGYQVMLPESVAIVCAPSKDPDHGIFRLTDPPGKQAVLNCTKPGLFHPHDTDNLYTDATRPGHVSELAGLQFQVVDLRKKK